MMVVKIMSEHVDCFHEEQIQGQSRKIAELETRADYKEKMIDKLNENMKVSIISFLKALMMMGS